MSIYWIATGISGLIMNLARTIAVILFNNDPKNSTFFYFFIATSILAYTIYCYLKISKELNFRSKIIYYYFKKNKYF